jgi:hypothetical protein
VGDSTYSPSHGSISRTRKRLSWIRFLVAFLTPYRHSFLPHPIQFVIHRPCRPIIWATEGCVEWSRVLSLSRYSFTACCQDFIAESLNLSRNAFIHALCVIKEVNFWLRELKWCLFEFGSLPLFVLVQTGGASPASCTEIEHTPAQQQLNKILKARAIQKVPPR